MFTDSIDYTICSTDESHYNRINCNLTAPVTKYAAMTVTCLTANCDIVVLNSWDYIMIDGKQFSFETGFTNLNAETFVGLLNDLFTKKNVTYRAELDSARRFKIVCDKKFVIDRMTYHFRLITGFYQTEYENKALFSDYNEEQQMYYVRSNSIGFTNLTPVLYLTSNIAINSYRNVNNELSGSKIVMRLNNSFMPGSPIIVNNADFETTLLSNDLSSLEFTLVDAFMKEVRLLSPMYLSIHVRAIPDEETQHAIFEGQEEKGS